MGFICTNHELKLINEILRDFTNITKFAASFISTRGKTQSPLYHFSTFCTSVRNNKIYCRICNQCGLYGGLESTKDPVAPPYRCHMGLVEFSIPIIKNDDILGFIIAGQVRVDTPVFNPILDEQTTWKSQDILKKLYDKLPVFTSEQIYSAAKVLRILVNAYFPTSNTTVEEYPYNHLPDFVDTEKPINRPEIRKAILYIEKNLTNRVSLRRIAEHIHLSESYFSKIFKEDMGLSVVQYITLLRIQEAKKLLVYSQLSVNQISKTLGYSRLNYFSRIFKTMTNETPHEYRKKYAPMDT